jgi:hypothetical protein
MDVCCASGGGHRRAQADCPLPEVCPSVRCAAVFQGFYNGCSAELEASPELGAGLAALSASCTEILGGSSLAQQLNLECTDSSLSTEDCIPPCNAEYHGYMLLLNLDGDDSKFSCNLAHGRYSWMGAASEGGYIGADAQSFFSAIVSGAAGFYIVTLVADVGTETDVIVRPGQDVNINGNVALSPAATWGNGGFTVQERASLAVAHVVLNSDLTVVGGGSARLSACTLGATFSVTLSTGARPVSLGLASMAVPATILATALAQQVLSGTGSALRLSAVTVPEFPDQGALTGTATVGAGGSTAIDPGGWGLTGAPKFLVLSGPCTVSESGRCVGRARGYTPDEACAIVVGGGLGVLEPCGVFDTVMVEYVTLP